MTSISDRPVALVTGASRGIGRAVAEGFAAAGYQVAVNCKNSRAAAEEVLRGIEERGGAAFLVPADVADRAAAQAMVKNILERTGRLDVLVNNAGTCRNRTVVNLTEEEWDEVIATNLSGPFHVLQACAKALVKQRGAVINVGSIAGLAGSFGNANYAASKGALVALTRSAARELGRFGVRVNCVLPGFHLTDMGKCATDRYVDEVRAQSVLGITTDLNELVRFIVSLAGMKSVSGQTFNIDSRIP